MRAVLDASAFVDDAIAVARHGVDRVEAPAIIDVEVLSAIRGLERRGEISREAADDIIAAWRSTSLRRHPIPRLSARIWQLRHNITATDASYVALAEALGVPLVTTDRHLARAASYYCDVVIPS